MREWGDIPKLKTYLPYILSILALTVFGVYLYRNAERYRQLLDVNPKSLLSLFGLSFAIPLANGSINYLLFRNLGVHMSFNESFGLAAVNTLANQLPFSGGLIAKGIYLKKRHGLTYTKYLSAMVATYVCFIAANGVIGLIITAFLASFQGARIPALLALGFVAMTISVVVLVLPIRLDFLPTKWKTRINNVAEGWQVLSQDRILLLQLILIQVITTIIAAQRFQIAFSTLSQDVSYAQCLLFSSATILTRLISVTPGGLGVREGIVAGLASVLGFDPGVSAVAVGLDRLISTVGILGLGVIYTYSLSKRIAHKHNNEIT
jgi:uncharacterized membrane protein YbhN (UPF0104 family)